MLLSLEPSGLLVGVVVWFVVYCADYYLTLHGNQLRAKYAKPHMSTAESYELNPYYQRDVDANKRVSRRFIFMLLLFTGWLVLLWAGARAIGSPELFDFAVGFVVLLEMPILNEHQRNIATFNIMRLPGTVVGSVTYARWVSYKLLSRSAVYWLLAYGVLFLLTGNWFFVGGMVAMVSLYLRFGRTGDQLRKKSPTVDLKPAVSTVADDKK